MTKKSTPPPAPKLPEESLEIPELGGHVLVRGLLLRDRITLATQVDAGFARVARMLHLCVLRDDGKPIYTEEEWERFGAIHFDIAVDLWTKAQALSGLSNPQKEEVPAKN